MAAFQQKVTQLADTTKWPKLSAFLPQNLWPWIWHYLQVTFRRKYRPYPGYDSLATGIYLLKSASGGGSIHLSIAGDWGTGTQESADIADAIETWKSDYNIHLGDVYYVGDDPEVKENFLGISTSQYTPVYWPKGTVGTFTLLGNHEMYGGGSPYFGEMLQYCETGDGSNQSASFFCLEGESWRIIALDTGYNSVGIPILGSIPGVKKIPFIGANCKLEQALLSWLENTVKPQSNPKATLLLSHHQFYSDFSDEAYGKPAKQISQYFPNQEVIWMFGHEHRLAVYDSIALDNGMRAYARCLGHGGMPVDSGKPKKSLHLELYDPRTDYPLDSNGSAGGWNGFVNLTVDGATLLFEYFDIKGQCLLRETFESLGALERLKYDRTLPVPVLIGPPA